MTVQEIATWLHGEIIGNGNATIDRVAKIEEADQHSISFLSNPKYDRYLETTQAAAVLISAKYDSAKLPRRPSLAYVKVGDPYLAFVHMHRKLTPTVDPFPSGIDPTAVIAKSAKLGNNVALGAHVVVGPGVTIGDDTRISAGCVLAIDSLVGSQCTLYPNVTIYHQCTVGNRVVIHSGAVVGSDGFGFVPKKNEPFEKIPQLGIVVIEDDVEIGANCTIDRATIGETVLEQGVKLDNLVHVAHNCTIGKFTVIAAQTGMAGSVKIGRNCMIGGQVGIAGHLEIADGVTILAQSGVGKSIEEPGSFHWGTPTKERRRAQQIEAAIRSLPEMYHDLIRLQNDVKVLQRELKGKKP